MIANKAFLSEDTQKMLKPVQKQQISRDFCRVFPILQPWSLHNRAGTDHMNNKNKALSAVARIQFKALWREVVFQIPAS